MPTAEQVAAVYDFEAVMENALKAVFTASEIKAFTSQDFGKVDAEGNPLVDFQKDRPRVEVMFVPGAGQGRWREINISGKATPVELAWKGQFKLELITESQMDLHAAFRTQIRFLMHTMGRRINNVGDFVNHMIQPYFRDGGTSPVMTPEAGVMQSTMLFDIDFSVQDYAWETIES